VKQISVLSIWLLFLAVWSSHNTFAVIVTTIIIIILSVITATVCIKYSYLCFLIPWTQELLYEVFSSQHRLSKGVCGSQLISVKSLVDCVMFVFLVVVINFRHCVVIMIIHILVVLLRLCHCVSSVVGCNTHRNATVSDDHVASHFVFRYFMLWLFTWSFCMFYGCVLLWQNSITPLHVASKWGRLNIVEFLVDRGAYKECKTRVSADCMYFVCKYSTSFRGFSPAVYDIFSCLYT